MNRALRLIGQRPSGHHIRRPSPIGLSAVWVILMPLGIQPFESGFVIFGAAPGMAAGVDEHLAGTAALLVGFHHRLRHLGANHIRFAGDEEYGMSLGGILKTPS
jgi:hypothetical protein